MRRASALVPSLAAILLAAALALAPAAGSAPSSAPAPSEFSAEFKLHAEGFAVRLQSQIGEGTVVLSLVRGPYVAAYETPATITATSLAAKFGRLGELDLKFRPAPASGRGGTLGREGVFEGTIAFTGEGGYVHIDAERVRGSVEALGAPSRSSGSGATPPPTRAALAASREEGVTLGASTRTGPGAGHYLLVRGERDGNVVRTLVSAGIAERREGMVAVRGAQITAGRKAFAWDLAAGRATVDPPAPFAGSAVFRRRSHGRPLWSGSLRVPILGRSRPLRLAGRRFRARLGPTMPD
jgi:hypothetical protein